MAKGLFTTVKVRVPAARLAAAAALVLTAIPAWGAPPFTCAVARRVFRANCAVCHMPTGTGNAAIGTPNFTDPKWQAEHKNPELLAAVTNGVKGTAMPSWKSQFSQQEIQSLVKCVVRDFGKKDPPVHHSAAAKSTKSEKSGK